MQLWTWKTAQSIVDASDSPEHDLPSPYQFSMLIGICMASSDRLRRWASYRYFRQQRMKAPLSPKVLIQAALMLFWCLAMATLMFAADTLIHYTTKTVDLDRVSVSSNVQAFGRGLSQECLSLNRRSNDGFPCTINTFISDDAYFKAQNEMLFLLQNTSQTSEVRTFRTDNGTDVAFLLPKVQNISPYIDYRASTIGITTQCKPISQLCNFEAMSNRSDYARFSCNPKFYGALGLIANETYNPNIPPLAFEMSKNLM